MSKRWKAQIKNRTVRGTGFGPQLQGKPDERGLYDLRPMRFELLRGASGVEILTDLVNLPNDVSAVQVTQFIERFHNLALGGTSSGGRKAPPMTPKEVIRLRGLYRQFWEVQHGPYRSILFMQRIGPQLEALQSAVPARDVPIQDTDLFPMLDYKDSALQMDWRTGQFRIVARGPVDWLTHAVFQNRNRLRACPKCDRLFVASGPNESLCSQVCKLEAGRNRRRKWWGKANRSGKKQKRRHARAA